MLEVVHYDKETNTHYVASGFGEKSQWYQNIIKTPDVTIQVGNQKFPATAKRLPLDEAEKIFEIYQQKHPNAIKNLSKLVGYEIGDSEEKMRAFKRVIPIIALYPQN
jgi:deazaflavin-dependent oxidoreductase (nitroreductase family)